MRHRRKPGWSLDTRWCKSRSAWGPCWCWPRSRSSDRRRSPYNRAHTLACRSRRHSSSCRVHSCKQRRMRRTRSRWTGSLRNHSLRSHRSPSNRLGTSVRTSRSRTRRSHDHSHTSSDTRRNSQDRSKCRSRSRSSGCCRSRSSPSRNSPDSFRSHTTPFRSGSRTLSDMCRVCRCLEACRSLVLRPNPLRRSGCPSRCSCRCRRPTHRTLERQ
jgi:hypothetical protein